MSIWSFSIYSISFFIIIIIYSLLLTFSVKANEQQKQLEKLFNDLKINNFSLANSVEQKIWKIWSTHPKENKLTLMLSEGSDLVKKNQLSNSFSTLFLAFDIVQLGLLFFLTGGITNPFVFLIIVPAVFSSQYLNLYSSILLVLLISIILLLLTFFYSKTLQANNDYFLQGKKLYSQKKFIESKYDCQHP